MALYDDLISPDLRIRNARSELDENYLFDPANEIPNAETIAALQEYEEIMKHPERYKTYATIEEAVADILSEDIKDSLSDYSFSALRIDEEDGSVTLALNEIDLVENGTDESDARARLAAAILEYAEDYYSDFSYWSSASNRASHIPYVFKALFIGDVQKIGESIKCIP